MQSIVTSTEAEPRHDVGGASGGKDAYAVVEVYKQEISPFRLPLADFSRNDSVFLHSLNAKLNEE